MAGTELHKASTSPPCFPVSFKHSTVLFWMSWYQRTASLRVHSRLTDVGITSIKRSYGLGDWPLEIQNTKDEHHAIYEMGF